MSIPSQAWSLSNDLSSVDRLTLAKFWLAAPSDQLESLWSLKFGKVTMDIVRSLSVDTTFSSDEVQLRDQIGSHFNKHGLSQDITPQLMIAKFLFSPPTLLKINNANDYLPDWLYSAYIQLYETSSQPLSTNFASTASPSASGDTTKPLVNPEKIDFGDFPASLQELVANRLHLNRLLGLSNLYYIDPEDEEITSELLQLRTNLAQIIFSCPESDLEN